MKRLIWEIRFLIASKLLGWALDILPRGFDTTDDMIKGIYDVLSALERADYYKTTGETRPKGVAP
jgi:hypothetical protein